LIHFHNFIIIMILISFLLLLSPPFLLWQLLLLLFLSFLLLLWLLLLLLLLCLSLCRWYCGVCCCCSCCCCGCVSSNYLTNTACAKIRLHLLDFINIPHTRVQVLNGTSNSICWLADFRHLKIYLRRPFYLEKVFHLDRAECNHIHCSAPPDPGFHS